MKQHKLIHRKGFTLLELLVSMSITVIIIGLLVFVTRSAFSTLAEGTNNLKKSNRSVVVLDQLASDLESMVFRYGSNAQWLATSAYNTTAADPNYGVYLPVGGVANNATGYASRLAFYTTAQDRYNGDLALAGDVSCVEYGIGFLDPLTPAAPTAQTFVLYRQLINPDDTFTNLTTSPTLLAGIDAFRAGAGTPLVSAQNILATNIKELTVTFHIRYTNAAGIVVIDKIPILTSGNATTDGLKLNDFYVSGTGIGTTAAAGNATPLANGKIIAVDINAEIISEDDIPRLNTAAANSALQQNLEKTMTRYSKTLYIPQLTH